ncbi:hypothetical protein NW762_010752 [Fusarium torreyae]|uniref:DUF3638 domain-containing protein n=1 Tax=Fusarium torreyae TaxID=1237075 RepID=A0A9W8VAF7_9HYPO|nr:hypothetical protein NW762_010752 [Fusarium torreyae]
MIDPPSNENAVMQLNMGEGKSTVIVPIVAIALGDASKLVRVIVIKPPSRWVIIQEVLGLISKFAGKSKSEFPKSLEFDDRHSERYPRIRLLRPDAEEAILSRVASSICDTGMPGFPIARQPRRTRDLIHHYVTYWELKIEDIQAVEESLFWDETTIGHILLL